MNEKELLRNFLGGYPETSHPKDRKRFISYAAECVRNGHYIDTDAMRMNGMSEESIERYETAFS